MLSNRKTISEILTNEISKAKYQRDKISITKYLSKWQNNERKLSCAATCNVFTEYLLQLALLTKIIIRYTAKLLQFSAAVTNHIAVAARRRAPPKHVLSYQTSK